MTDIQPQRDYSETKQNEYKYKNIKHLSYYNIIIKTKEDILKTSRIRISKKR